MKKRSNKTSRDARIRIQRASKGSTKKATLGYLLSLRKHLLKWIDVVDRKIFEMSYIEVDDDDIVTQVYTIEKEK